MSIRGVITQADESVLRLIQARFNGRLKLAKSGGRKQCYQLHLYGENLVGFLCAVRPYLRVKRLQAELALHFFENLRHDKGRPECWAERYMIYTQLKDLKYFGSDASA